MMEAASRAGSHPAPSPPPVDGYTAEHAPLPAAKRRKPNKKASSPDADHEPSPPPGRSILDLAAVASQALEPHPHPHPHLHSHPATPHLDAPLTRRELDSFRTGLRVELASMRGALARMEAFVATGDALLARFDTAEAGASSASSGGSPSERRTERDLEEYLRGLPEMDAIKLGPAAPRKDPAAPVWTFGEPKKEAMMDLEG